jgi:glycosyltransferase involved in cell wall biosynthesis
MKPIEPKDDRVFIGIPCYKRHEGLANTVRCLQQQTHANWSAVIYDNASPNDEMRRVTESVCESDSRIRCFRHPENIGAAANFHFAAMQADAPYFMWASDDDQWHPEFIATNLQLLNKSPSAQMSFGTIDVINVFGDVLFRCPGFSRFCSSGNIKSDAENYLEDPEALGKANLIYGLYRTPAIQACVEAYWNRAFARFYGGDFVFLYAFLCRHPIVAHDEVHMRKRQPTRAKTKRHWRHPRSYRVSRSTEFEAYLQRFRDVAPNDTLADLAERILRRRQKERFYYYVPFLATMLEGKDRKTAKWPTTPRQILDAPNIWG